MPHLCHTVEMRTRHPKFTRGSLAVAVIAMAVVAVGCAPTTPGGDPAWYGFALTGWSPVASYSVDSLTSAQGLATVNPPSGPAYSVYDNFGSIPQSRVDAGWPHVGDPDSRSGYTVYPYQAETSSLGKLFEVVTPAGQHFDYFHALAAGERTNNSFAAISPDGQWLVSGEWGTMTRFLVMPNPILNTSTAAAGGTLPLAGTINLATSVSNIQGCTFTSDTRLVCSSDDAAKSLQQVDLASALSGGSVSATVTRLGYLPQVSACTATAGDGFEAEGIDYDFVTGLLRVIVVPPGVCGISSTVYEYRARP